MSYCERKFLKNRVKLLNKDIKKIVESLADREYFACAHDLKDKIVFCPLQCVRLLVDPILFYEVLNQLKAVKQLYLLKIKLPIISVKSSVLVARHEEIMSFFVYDIYDDLLDVYKCHQQQEVNQNRFN